MPNSLLTLETPAPAPATEHAGLMSFLRGKDNPFDVFVAARKPEADFARVHVPDIHQDIARALNAVVERYRLPGLEWDSDLPRSGVVVVEGKRGIGKTHMVHALQRRAGDGRPCLAVTPVIYEPQRPFMEYLLHQVVRHLQSEADERAPGTLELLADAFTRQALVQALRGMTEIDWLAREAAAGRFWRYFFGVGVRLRAERRRRLIHDLEQAGDRTLREVCAENEVDFQPLRTLALQQIRSEPSHTIAGQIRRGLYDRLVGLAFGAPRETVYDFLLDGYTEVDAKIQPARETLVDELFQALLELCLLARLPIIFLFDALESLLGDPPDKELCHPFFKGLADVLDSHRGIPFLLFAEIGHWQQLEKSMISSYALQRIQQGVIRVPGHGSLSRMQMPNVTAAQLQKIVASRMRPLLREYFEADSFDAPPIFPLREEDLERIVRSPGEEPPLRQALQALRDRYDERLGNRVALAPAAQPSAAVAEGMLIEPLEACWQRELRKARQILEAGCGGQADELHAGLLKWLQCLIADGVANGAGMPVAAANDPQAGAHPTYGQITKCQWRAGTTTRALGIGLLLGEKRAMPRDLETKLKMMAGPVRPADLLILLWPRGSDLTPPYHEHLPAGTRAMWDQFAANGTGPRVQLRAVAPVDLAPWLALPKWWNQIATETPHASASILNHFVAEQTAPHLAFIAPES
jgi:hypothetical protein